LSGAPPLAASVIRKECSGVVVFVMLSGLAPHSRVIYT
jgi:hypothetical protein